MKNKKGFTIVEIIVTLALITIIGTAIPVTIMQIKKNSNKDLESITKQILEAANVYVTTKKDDNGNSYFEEIYKGAKGVQIPVSSLVSEGIIEESMANDLYTLKNVTKKQGESYYVLFLQGGTDVKDYCEEGEITALASWMEEGKAVYLCKDYNKPEEQEEQEEKTPNIVEAQKSVRLVASLDKFAVSHDFKIRANSTIKESLTDTENGVFTFYNESTKKVYYYYRGAVDNNYLKFGKDKSGNDLYWRIIWMNDKNEMKIVLDEIIPLYFENKLGQTIPVTPKLTVNGLNNYYYFNAESMPGSPECKTDKNGYRDCYYTYKIFNDRQLTLDVWNTLDSFSGTSGTSGVYTKGTFWTENNLAWYNSTNLKNYSYILNKNLCSNPCYRDQYYSNYYFYPSDNFECLTGSTLNTNGCQYAEYSASSNKVGFLTYGDLIRAGVISSNSDLTNLGFSLKDSGNYLTDSIGDYNILLGDVNYIYSDSSREGEYYYDFKNYYYNASGISNSYIKNDARGSSDCRSCYYYSLLDENGNYLVTYAANQGRSNKILYKGIFLANALKPTLTINMSSKKLSDALGTKENAFEIVNK